MPEIIDILTLTILVSSLHACYSSLEFLSIRERYREGDLMDWNIVRLEYQNRLWSVPLQPLMRYFAATSVVRLLVGFTIGAILVFNHTQGQLIEVTHPAFILLVAVLTLTDIVILLRNNGGLSGAYHMSLIVNFGVLVALIAPMGGWVQLAALGFIAIQGILGYFIAGGAKLRGELWRQGTALSLILSTETWGHPRVYSLLKRFPRLSFVGSWGVILFETLFPLVLFLGPGEVLVVFGMAILLHISIAFTMGIPTFILIFPATYPAIYYISVITPSFPGIL